MRKFLIKVPQLYISHREVEAENDDEAINLARDQEEFDLEYFCTLEEEQWQVTEI